MSKKENLTKEVSPLEHEVITLIKEKEECRYGDVIKELRLSYSKGQETIYSLVSKGLIQFIGRSSKLKLATNAN